MIENWTRDPSSGRWATNFLLHGAADLLIVILKRIISTMYILYTVLLTGMFYLFILDYIQVVSNFRIFRTIISKRTKCRNISLFIEYKKPLRLHKKEHWFAISSSSVFCPSTGPLLQTQAPRLQFCQGRSSIANSGTYIAFLLGINRSGSFPLLSAPHSLFSIWSNIKRYE